MSQGAFQSMQRGAITLRWSAATHVGKVRKLNEDTFLAEPGVFAVADGMGGHAAGEVASRLAIDEWSTLTQSVPVSADLVAEVVTRANHRVWEHAQVAGTLGMGTTLVGVALVDNAGEEALVVANVGDSRCYALTESGLRRVTRDHSVVQELIDGGAITTDEADRHPERNVVTRAIGIEALVAADFVVLDRVPQRILLCSDGVSGQVGDKELHELLESSATCADAVVEILNSVLLTTANDNATLVVIDVEWSPTSPEGLERNADDITGPRAFDASGDGGDNDMDDTNPRPKRPPASLIDSVPSPTPSPGEPAPPVELASIGELST